MSDQKKETLPLTAPLVYCFVFFRGGEIRGCLYFVVLFGGKNLMSAALLLFHLSFAQVHAQVHAQALLCKGCGFGQIAKTHMLWICAGFNVAWKKVGGS